MPHTNLLSSEVAALVGYLVDAPPCSSTNSNSRNNNDNNTNNNNNNNTNNTKHSWFVAVLVHFILTEILVFYSPSL